MLSLQTASKRFGLKNIFDKINLTINENERIFLIGKNGSGKSTLLKVINGELELDSGKRILKQGLDILMLNQESNFSATQTVSEVLKDSMRELLDAHLRLSEITKDANFHNDKALSEEYNHIHNLLDRQDAWDLESKVSELIRHFNLESLKDRLVISLSGGEQKRVSLACVLLKGADLLILDEPTNHLDVEMLSFLESMLVRLKCSMLIISHDRYFIDKVATNIIELDNAKLTSFKGNYEDYLQAKQTMLDNLNKEHLALKKILKSEEEWLRAGVKARLKRNEGRKQRVLELRDKVKKMPSLAKSMMLSLESNVSAPPKNSKKMLFELDDVNLKVGEKTLISNLNIRITQGGRLGIVGRNGSGKTSLLRMLLTGKDYEGNKVKGLKIGDFKIGYYEQHKNTLDLKKTILETFCPNGGDRVQVNGKDMHVYGYLKSFLFDKDLLTQSLDTLSGGEKTRVALALLLAQEYDCLILDEPTNDLDIATINILERFLSELSCALIFVSHDRYFNDKLAERLLVLEDDGYFITSASYTEVLEHKNMILEAKALEAKTDSKNIESKSMDFKSEDFKHTKPNEEAKKPKLSYKINLEYERLPSEIAELEVFVKELERRLGDPKEYQKYGIDALSKELAYNKELLDSKLIRYFEIEDMMK
ncbi:ribosomal protection-like ABC-F family protein [Helicobacter sp. 13S00401-1]|uniref:ribosomal protection-like ABC-F family protein n=1 Tax=Helicobacter sp. 13S00401-1 TaxID=1905758 RepID=UPI00209BCDC6|nr:ABC-F family ATP-binding cassette domain-containing protein [Helicobacter sp. 13S00401-1]